MQYSMYMLVNQLILVDQRNSLSVFGHREYYVPCINLVFLCQNHDDNDINLHYNYKHRNSKWVMGHGSQSRDHDPSTHGPLWFECPDCIKVLRE